MTKTVLHNEDIFNKKTLKFLKTFPLNLKSDSVELQILDISLSKVDPLTIQKIDDKTLKKIKYLDVINDDWVKKQSIASVLKQRDKMLRERCSVEFSIDEICKIFELDSNEITDEKLTKIIRMIIDNLHTQNSPIFLEGSYNPSLGIKLVVNYLSPEIREHFFDKKEDSSVSSLSDCYLKIISIFQFVLERKLTDAEIIQVGYWCQRYSEDKMLRSLYLVEIFIKDEEKNFSCIEEILKVCYDTDIRVEAFFGN